MHTKVKGFCVRVLAGGVAGDNLITTDAGISRTPSGAVLGGAQGAGRGPKRSLCGVSGSGLDSPAQGDKHGNGQGNGPVAPHLTHGMPPQTTPAPRAALGQALGTGWSNIRTTSHATQTVSTST